MDSLEIWVPPSRAFCGGRSTEQLTKRGSRRGERRQVGQRQSVRLSRSRIAAWVFGGETDGEASEAMGCLAGWLAGWFAHGSLSDLRWSRSRCISNKFRADPRSSPCISTHSCIVRTAAPRPTLSLSPRPFSGDACIITHRSAPPSSLFFQLFHHIRTDTPSPTDPFRRLAGHHPRWASLRRPERPGQRRSSSP